MSAEVRAESDTLVTKIREHWAARQFGMWAVEIVGGPPFVGMCGLAVPKFEARFTPCVEVGWRFSPASWGHRYATEAARMALAYAFEKVGLEEVVSFTALSNVRSTRVMERIGMARRTEDDFDHPMLSADHRLSRHVLYRISRDEWLNRKAL